MMCCSSVAIQNCVEGGVLHADIYGLAVLISSLLVPLLLEGCVAGLQSGSRSAVQRFCYWVLMPPALHDAVCMMPCA